MFKFSRIGDYDISPAPDSFSSQVATTAILVDQQHCYSPDLDSDSKVYISSIVVQI